MMQQYLSALLIVFLASAAFSDAQADYTTVRTANKRFEAGNFAEAAQRYRSVIRREPESRNGTVAAFNLGNALFRKDHLAEAAAHFREIAAKPEHPEGLRADARFNAGNAYARLAMRTDGKRQKKKLLQAALREYRGALLITPDDQQCKINHEIIQRRLKSFTSPPATGNRNASNPGGTGIRNDIASNILEQTAKDEQNVLRNRYHDASRLKQGGSNSDW